jgi:predicted RecB family nuclease
VENYPQIAIKASTLRLLSTCQRRIWLDRYEDVEERDEITPITAYRLNAGIQHEKHIHQETAPNPTPIVVQSWAEGVNTTKELMKKGAKTILGAYLEADVFLEEVGCFLKIRGRVDRLVSNSVDFFQKRIHRVYRPIEIKIYGQVGPADQLQLDCYIWLLNQMDRIRSLDGQFWLGRNEVGKPKERLDHLYDETRLLTAFSNVARLLLNEKQAPEIFLTHHCKTCHWYSACMKKAEGVLDVSLLSGLRRDTLQDFQAAGVTTLNQLAAMQPHQLRQFRGIKSTAEEFHTLARSWVEKKPIWYNNLPEISFQDGWMFDLETYETVPITSSKVWSIGWGCRGNTSLIIIAPEYEQQQMTLTNAQIVTLVPDEATAWKLFAQALSVDNRPIFHWTHYDATIMRKTAPEDVIQALESRLYDLHRIFKKSVKFPVDGTSLKTVANYLGFAWSEYEDYFQAYMDYRRWLRTGDVKLLTSSCAYQSDDVIALEKVWEWLVTNTPQR